MPRFVNSVDLNQNELQNVRLQNITAGAPSPAVLGQLYFDSNPGALRVMVCVAAGSPGTWAPVATGTPPDADAVTKGLVQLAGDLSGTAASPQIATGAIVAADINTTLKPSGSAAAGTESLRALGTTASTAAAGNDARFTDSRAPSGTAGGDLSGSYPNPQIAPLVIVDGDVSLTAAIAFSKLATPTADWAVGAHKITGVAEPQLAQDAATKNYVDNAIAGLSWKDSAKAASVGPLTLSAPQTVDGVALIAGDRVLVKDQAGHSADGIYLVAAGAWTRTLDADASVELDNAALFVEQGTVNADTTWVQTASVTTLGTTAQAWAQFGGGQIVAGTGLTKTGNSIALTTPVTIALGGTGAANAPAARTALGATGKYTALNVGGGLTFSIPAGTHALGATRAILVQVMDEATGDVVYPNVTVAANGDVTIAFSLSQSANSMRAVLIA